ncbi:MAG: hypothetical protein IMZ59_04760 [Actinobacteria bacterium]|nr:hypothetical protein [Actinomycetota bacterium]
MRWGYPLEYFKTGKSAYYVFLHCGEGNEDYMEDYGETYKDDKSLIELIGRIIYHETKDEKYTWKMVKILAKKLGVEDDLREKPLDSDEWFDMVIGKSVPKKKSRKNNADSKQKCIHRGT